MKHQCEKWQSIKADYEMVDASGKPLVLKNVPAEACPICNEIRFSPEEVLRAEQEHFARAYGVDSLEGNVLLFLCAEGPRFTEKQQGEIHEKYRFNKMLFYHWQELDKTGLGQARMHHQFISEARGPIPKDLDATCKSLEEKGLVKMQWGGKAVKKPYIYKLTPKGLSVAKALWEKTPDAVREAITKPKQELFLLGTDGIRDKVHWEFPEYKKSFVRPDDE